MKDFHKAIITGVILGAALFSAWDAHAQAVGQASHGHHGGGNNGAMGASAGAFGGSAGSAGQAAGNAGQSGAGGNYWAPNPHASLIDAYQPYPQAEMMQFQKP